MIRRFHLDFTVIKVLDRAVSDGRCDMTTVCERDAASASPTALPFRLSRKKDPSIRVAVLHVHTSEL